MTAIELIVALAIGVIAVSVVYQVQRGGIVGYQKGIEMTDNTRTAYLLLEHLKSDARTALSLETVSSGADEVEYRIGRVVFHLDSSGSVMAIESRYSYNRDEGIIRRIEYNLSTHEMGQEREYRFDPGALDMELTGGTTSPIEIGLKFAIDGEKRWLRLQVASPYTAPTAGRWKYHTIPEEIIQLQDGFATPVALAPGKFGLSPKYRMTGETASGNAYDRRAEQRLLKAYAKSFSVPENPDRP